MAVSVDHEQSSVAPAPLLSVPDVAAALAVSVPTVRRLISRGELGAVRIGGQVRVTPGELERLVTAGQRESEGEVAGG
jgi:excisionase family DNA binding protein